MNKRKRNKNITEPFSEKVLNFFSTGSPLTFAQTKAQFYGFIVGPKEVSSSQLYKTVYKLRKQGWLEKKKSHDEIYYSLTRQGKFQVKLYNLRKTIPKRGTSATIIMFDIPEEKRTYRNFLRRLLKQLKFTMIQKSVFITPFILPEAFYEFLREMDLIGYVKVVEGKMRIIK